MILKRGEQKNVNVVVTYGNKPLDVKTSTITMAICDKNNNIIKTKEDVDFSKINGVMGNFSFMLTSTDTDITPASYVMYIKLIVGNMIDKTIECPLTIEASPL